MGKKTACLKAKRLLNKLHFQAMDELSPYGLLTREDTELTNP